MPWAAGILKGGSKDATTFRHFPKLCKTKVECIANVAVELFERGFLFPKDCSGERMKENWEHTEDAHWVVPYQWAELSMDKVNLVPIPHDDAEIIAALRKYVISVDILDFLCEHHSANCFREASNDGYHDYDTWDYEIFKLEF